MTGSSKRYDFEVPWDRSAISAPSGNPPSISRHVLPGGHQALALSTLNVELPRGAVAPKFARSRVVEAGLPEELGELGAVPSRSSFSTQSAPSPATDPRAFRDAPRRWESPERLAGVAADDEAAGLRHEPAQVSDGSAHDDVDALHRDPACVRRRVALHDA